MYNMPGAGAACGLDGAFQAFFPATMKRGVDAVIEYSRLRDHLRWGAPMR
ncbi:glycerate kinase [Paenibacillus sp. LHD-38]|nr:glycerate kinase [Paenibacillus sp. LHD-38]MDQ8736190.1 glycerate kinase [Paenibacillus sp. LHD-38]